MHACIRPSNRSAIACIFSACIFAFLWSALSRVAWLQSQSGFDTHHHDVVVPRKTWSFGICVYFRDEGPHLLEWIAHHRAVGVTHFFMYDHGSTDGYYDTVEPLIAAGILSIFSVASVPADRVQGLVIHHCMVHQRRAVDWIAHIDMDEFLVPSQGQTLRSLFTAYSHNISAVYAYRYDYAASGFKEDPPASMLDCEAYIKRLPDANTSPKWVIRSNSHAGPTGGHNIGDDIDVICSTGAGLQIPCGHTGNSTVPTDWMQHLVIAHHVTRSISACKRKQAYHKEHFPGAWRAKMDMQYCELIEKRATVFDPSCMLRTQATLDQMFCLNPHEFGRRFGNKELFQKIGNVTCTRA